MKLYWKVKINGKWTFRKAMLWRFEPTSLVDEDGYVDGYMGGVFIQTEILEDWREFNGFYGNGVGEGHRERWEFENEMR